MKTLVIGETPGGTIILTDVMENYLGFKKLTGLELADKIREHALEYGGKTLEAKVERVRRCRQGCFIVSTSKQSFHVKTIIFATGTEWRKLDVPGEKEFVNKGVHYCAPQGQAGHNWRGENVTAAFSAYQYINENEIICICDDEEETRSV